MNVDSNFILKIENNRWQDNAEKKNLTEAKHNFLLIHSPLNVLF